MKIEFNDNDKIVGSFMKWEKIGDKVQGTLIGRRQKPNDLKPGEDQWIYELLTAEDNIALIGGKVGIDMQMKHVKLGQIVELRYIEERPSKRPGFDPTKVIQVYTRKDAMNEEWLKNQEELAMSENVNTEVAGKGQGEIAEVAETDGEIKVDEIPFDDPKPKVEGDAAQTIEEKKAIISNLANEKLGAAEEDVMQKVMEATSLAYINSNLDSIIKKLTEYQAK